MLAEWVGVAMLATVLALVLALSGVSARLDNVAYDAAVRMTPRPTSQDVIIVAFDDRALDEAGAWPWPRSVHAALIERLSQAGAKAIAYDVLFVEPTSPPQDQALAQALAASGKVCLPVLIEAPGRDGAAFRLSPPAGALAQAAAGLGHVDLDYDADGVSRRANLVERAGGRAIGHLMACAQQVAAGAAMPPLSALPRPVGGEPLVRADTMLIPYGGPPGRVRTISAASVLRGETPPAFFKDRYVIVGATAAGLHDRHSTPVSTANEAMAGVEVQANLLEGLIEGRLIRAAPIWAQASLTVLLVWIFLLSLLKASPRRGLMIGFGLVAATLALSLAWLLAGRIWFAPSPAIITLLAVIPVWGWRRLSAASAYMLEELERFSEEDHVLPPGEAVAGGDPVERQISLMRLAAQRTRDLRAAAILAARQREEVTALLSHDIRSPQSSILALLETDKTPLAEKIAGYARRTLDLADNFVHLAKAESGSLPRELLDLSALATEAVEDLWPVAQRAQVRLRVQGEDEEHLVLGDRSLLTRAIVNLLDNAIKYSPAEGEVVAALSRADGAVSLAIIDHGPGLSDEEQATLFQRFARVGGAAKGVGLGLTLVDEVARRHDGKVACVSRPGEGASFILTLPLAREDAL